MFRRSIGILLILVWGAASAWAQEGAFKIDAASASVHKAPSTGSPVIGETHRGAVLDVTRELGSWVKVAWPAAPDGVGYVHVSAGAHVAAAPRADVVPTAPLARSASPSTGTPSSTPSSTISTGSRSVSTPGYVVAPEHVVGLGGQFAGSAIGSGINARTWVGNRVGLQLEVARSSFATTGVERMTTTHVAPSLLLSLGDAMTDYVWIRPYAGAGPRWLNQTLPSPSPGGQSISDGSFGVQTFGGAEFTFAAVPRMTVSADLRYGWANHELPGADLEGFGVAFSGHWYVK